MLNDRIEDDAVAAIACRRRADLQFTEHVIVRVVRIEGHRCSVVPAGELLDKRTNRRIYARTVNHVDFMCQRVGLDGNSIVSANVYIELQYSAPTLQGIQHTAGYRCLTVVDECQNRDVEDERAAVRNSSFCNKIRLDLPDQFLYPNNVWRILHNGP
jgi:hypothetical protein